MSRREALILIALINHPWLLHDHLEEVAALELGASRGQSSCAPRPSPPSRKIIIIVRSRRSRPKKCAPIWSSVDLTEVIQRVERAITTSAVWATKPGAAREDVLARPGISSCALHRQWHALLRELKDAELALGDEASEANLAWLRDVKARLSEMDGTEALIEGFGESSGRFQRSV